MAESNPNSPKRKQETCCEELPAIKRVCRDDNNFKNDIVSTNKDKINTNNEQELANNIFQSKQCNTDENNKLETEKNSNGDNEINETDEKENINISHCSNIAKDTDSPKSEDTVLNATNDDTNQLTVTNTPVPAPREKCKYGSQCYRLSAEHKSKFSHPGDSDYDIPDNRPECPYGKQCYRKNLQHKIDYKHTSNKRPRTQTSTSPEDLSDWEDSMDESVDESEYEPSFIDDDSLDEFESDFEENEDD